MHLKHDPGETPATAKDYWTGDEEQPTSPKDNWTCGNVPIRPSQTSPDEKPCKAACSQENLLNLLPVNLPSHPTGESTEKSTDGQSAPKVRNPFVSTTHQLPIYFAGKFFESTSGQLTILSYRGIYQKID